MSTKGAAFKTLAAPTKYEEVIKKSRFLTHAVSATSFTEAQNFLKRVSDLKATHNCWGWRGRGEERSSDDGEPGGTAGRPILSAIESEELEDVVVVVTRYFGGIKLGAGGLVRAYGGVARTCLRNAETMTHIPKVLVRLIAPLAMSGAVFQTISRVEKVGEDYTAEEVMVDVKVEASQVEGLRQQLQDATKGAGRLEEKADRKSVV